MLRVAELSEFRIFHDVEEKFEEVCFDDVGIHVAEELMSSSYFEDRVDDCIVLRFEGVDLD